MIFLLFISLFQLNISAADPTIEFNIEGANVKFYHCHEQRLLVSLNCLKNAKLKCKAYDALFSKSALTEQLETPVLGNPGHAICKSLKGEFVLGIDIHHNQNSFCRFSDGSYVDHGTLTYYHYNPQELTNFESSTPKCLGKLD